MTGDPDEDASESVDDVVVDGVWSMLGETVCGSCCAAADTDIMYALEKTRSGMSWEEGSVLRQGDTGAALNMSQVIPYETSEAMLELPSSCAPISFYGLASIGSCIPACHA